MIYVAAFFIYQAMMLATFAFLVTALVSLTIYTGLRKLWSLLS
jgi:hypothetical protein